jgi:hypothetical protein
MLSETRQAELSAQREQLGDVEQSRSVSSGGVSDQLTFDPRKVRQSRQESQIDPDNAFRGRNRPDADAGTDLSGFETELKEEIQSTGQPELDSNPAGQVRSNSGSSLRRGRFETRDLGTEVEVSSSTTADTRQVQDTAQRVQRGIERTSRTGLESRLDQDLGVEGSQEFELEQENQQDQSLELGVETGTETGTEFGVEQENEIESETGFKLERESEFETEFEAEDSERQDEIGDFGEVSNDELFSSGIASADDLGF